MPPAPDLVCVGHLVHEMVYFPDRVEGPLLGSPPAYCSVAAARQGMPTAIVSRIGPDMPDALLRPLAEAGVDLAGLHRDGTTTRSDLHYDARGHKEIRYPAKAAPIMAGDVPPAYRGSAMIYICPMDADVAAADVAAVAACGRLSAIDLGGYGGVHTSRARREAMDSPAELACGVCAGTTIAKASDEDARAIFGHDDLDRAARTLRDSGAEVVVLTAGTEGAHIYAATGRWHVPAIEGTVADATGGGDTFMAGFLTEFLRSGDAVAAAHWGAATAMAVIEQTGGVRVGRMPTHAAVQRRVAAAGRIRKG